mmetsp:Transcript_13449/g.29719  ORF Transcript_13449/g.29719 Transcript_13449/m.29719 type:complete len:107 (-) Transcript_13449:2909-3229(-)
MVLWTNCVPNCSSVSENLRSELPLDHGHRLDAPQLVHQLVQMRQTPNLNQKVKRRDVPDCVAPGLKDVRLPAHDDAAVSQQELPVPCIDGELREEGGLVGRRGSPR